MSCHALHVHTAVNTFVLKGLKLQSLEVITVRANNVMSAPSLHRESNGPLSVCSSMYILLWNNLCLKRVRVWDYDVKVNDVMSAPSQHRESNGALS